MSNRLTLLIQWQDTKMKRWHRIFLKPRRCSWRSCRCLMLALVAIQVVCLWKFPFVEFSDVCTAIQGNGDEMLRCTEGIMESWRGVCLKTQNDKTPDTMSWCFIAKAVANPEPPEPSFKLLRRSARNFDSYSYARITHTNWEWVVQLFPSHDMKTMSGFFTC